MGRDNQAYAGERDVFRRSAESIVEVNADQTSDTGPGFVTSTIRADPGELWVVENIFLEAPEIESNVFDGQSQSFTVETEAVGVEIGFGQVTRTNSGTGGLQRLRYQGGVFTADPEPGDAVNNTSVLSADRRDIIGTRVDRSNGLVVDYRNNTQADQTSDRRIRVQFLVVQI